MLWPSTLYYILLYLFCINIVACVDRGNFKKCSDSGFCKLHRELKPGLSVYKALPKSLVVGPTSVSFNLISYRNSKLLKADIFALEDNTWRLKIDELLSKKKRYQIPIGDVLIQEPQQQKFEVKQRDDERILLGVGSSTVVVQFSPFVLDVINTGRHVISINSRGLMKFQQTRVNSSRGIMDVFFDWLAMPFRDNEEVANTTEESSNEEIFESQDLPVEEDYVEGEESFKGFKDSKPYGPRSVGVDISFPGYQYVYGIPEHADSLALKNTRDTDPYRLYNLDVFEYELNNPMALYGSVPYMIAHNADQTVGVYWNNAAETWIDVEAVTTSAEQTDASTARLRDVEVKKFPDQQVLTHWFSETGVIDIFIMLGPRPRNVFGQYARLTGTTPLPPLFSLAYHQCRWNYMDEADVRSVHNKFDEYDIPVDVLWLDIEHTDGKRYFVWDQHRFSNAEEMLRNVSAKGRRMVATVDPHLKKDSSYYVYSQASSADVLVKNKDGSEYEGWCWPGSAAWVDFVCTEAREFWSNQFDLSTYKGSTLDLYTWNDMNEPSVFNGPEITMQKDVLHCDGSEHRDLHNVYGLYVHRATSEALEKRSFNQLRPFVLSRAFFAGSQRYGAIWTGDNAADWNHLKISLPMLLTLNLVGITFSGADVGGFFGNPDSELLTRWYQAGAFQPFFRAHAHLDTKRREPWLLEPIYRDAVRQAVRTRYRLMPYWYTLFREGEMSGMPVIRPLFVEFPSIRQTFSVEDEYMLGSGILIHPVTISGVSQVEVYLPGKEEVWYDFDTYEAIMVGNTSTKSVNISVDLNKIPVFLRSGYIIPLKERIRRTSDLVPDDPYTLLVILDKQQNSRGSLYHDDFRTFQYRGGVYVHMEYRLNEGLTFTGRNLNERKHLFQTAAWLEKIKFVGLNRQPKRLLLNVLGVESELEHDYNARLGVLTVRKPNINISADFSITFVY